jgi:hypothetical protein
MAQVWRQWWRKQSPSHQDRYALMGPLIAVVLFLTAITTAYLKASPLKRIDCIQALALFDPTNELVSSASGKAWLSKKK